MVFSRNSRVLKFSLWFIINRCEQLKIFFTETVIDILSFWHSIRLDSAFQSWDFYKKKNRFRDLVSKILYLSWVLLIFKKNCSGKTWCYRHRNVQFYNYKTFCKVKIFQGFWNVTLFSYSNYLRETAGSFLSRLNQFAKK